MRLTAFGVILLVSAPGPTMAQAGRARPAAVRTDTITFETSQATRVAADVAHDGSVVIFDMLGQLWTVSTAGGEARPLTNAVRDTAEDSDPALSPDGRWIAFRSERPGGKGVWLLDRETRAVRRLSTPLTAPYDDGRSPNWSADGRRLLFRTRDTLRVLDITSGAIRTLGISGLPTPAIRDQAWSADGTRILFINAAAFARNGGGLWEVPADGGTARPAGDSTQRIFAPAPSPDGRALAWLARDSAGRPQVWVQETRQLRAARHQPARRRAHATALASTTREGFRVLPSRPTARRSQCSPSASSGSSRWRVGGRVRCATCPGPPVD